jgi:hypothetical protein
LIQGEQITPALDDSTYYISAVIARSVSSEAIQKLQRKAGLLGFARNDEISRHLNHCIVVGDSESVLSWHSSKVVQAV